MKVIDTTLLHNLHADASVSSRLRCNFNLHQSFDDPVQRFCNALEPGAYVRPHRHRESDKWEFLLPLMGAVAVLLFDDAGKVIEKIELSLNGPVKGVEIAQGAWHTVIALAPATVLFECKPGPYRVSMDKEFAPWAPPEGSFETGIFIDWFCQARVGNLPPSWDKDLKI